MPWRRLATVPGYLIAWTLWIAAAPVWLALAFASDLVRRSRWVALRSAGVVTVYLTCEALGIVASGALWLWKSVRHVDEERWKDLHFELEAWWGATLFRAVIRLFGLRVEIDDDDARLEHGPYLLLVRHSSSGDTLLASEVVSRRYGFRLRYILKQEHLWDPCLDIVGHRVPNVFVDRSSENTAREVERVQEIARDLGPRDGILIYPEGTRFSEAKRSKLLERFQQKGHTKMLEYARSLGSVLPPRPGGTLGVLNVAPELDVVICSHTGFEGAASLADIWKGALVGRVIEIQFRRIPRAEIPSSREAQAEWLNERWREVGHWVETHQ